MLRTVLKLSSVGQGFVALWLVSVVLFVLPNGNADQIPFWVGVLGWFVWLAVGSWIIAERPARLLQIGLSISAVISFPAGISAIVSQLQRASQGKDFEGYIVLMGLLLAGHSLLLFLYVFRSHVRRFYRVTQ